MHLPSIALAGTLALAGAHAVGTGSRATDFLSTAPGTRLVVAPTGNEVRYRVREKLMDMDLPSDAVGKTTAIQGGMSLANDGSVISSASKFVIQAGTIQSDRMQRDRYLQNFTLETGTYATIEFVPTEVRGLPKSLPKSGTRDGQLIGNLTIHGVTKPVTWNLKVTSNGDELTGNATTSFAFSYFGLRQPSVPVVFSVEDKIVLEYDFHLLRTKID